MPNDSLDMLREEVLEQIRASFLLSIPETRSTPTAAIVELQALSAWDKIAARTRATEEVKDAEG